MVEQEQASPDGREERLKVSVNKNHLNVSQIYGVYMLVIGDAEKTALALDLDPQVVAELALREGWPEKIARLSVLSKSGAPGDWERAQNRALNWVQAHQLRRAVDRAVAHISMELEKDGGVEKILTHTTKDGSVIYSAKVFADLASSLEKIHSLSYFALGDSAKERADRGEHKGTDGDKEAKQSALLHAGLFAALNASKLDRGKPSEQLVAETVEKVEQLTATPPAASQTPEQPQA